MDGDHPHFTSALAPPSVQIPENNTVGAVVATITVQPGVTLVLNPPTDGSDNPFRLEGNNLEAARVFDYEINKNFVARITCKPAAGSAGSNLNIAIVVVLTNVNDNPPVFAENPYRVSINEMSPVGSVVGNFKATDVDLHSQLFYTLTSESTDFKLRSSTVPDVLVDKPLDYDKVKNVQLVLTVQDAPLTATDVRFTSTTTIMVTILDGDNRPPWFQPCTKHEVGGALICQNDGYTGRVNLNEQEAGALPLKPGPLYAIDGDSGINGEITYSFLSGNEDRLFDINANTGNITMLKVADVLGTISLTVLAAQKVNSFQFATTTVTISVQVKSLHPPQFQKPRYEGVITSMGSMAMDPTNEDKPLRILATDDDYTATGGLNPHITYSVSGSSDFSIIDGYLFMMKDLPEGTLSLQVVAIDTTNDETATAQLSVEVTSGLTSTSLPLSTTDITATTSMVESTTDIKTTEEILPTTTNPTTTSEGSVSTAPPGGHTFLAAASSLSPSGDFSVVDMAVLGATLGALLLVCLVVIGVLVHRMQRGKADWRKIYEANVFRSSLGQGSGGPKEGIQYTNEAFHNDEDGGSVGSGGQDGRSAMAFREPRKVVEDVSLQESIAKSSVPLHALLPDNTSEAGSSDKADSEKEVKPILTKERRVEEGYKSVWFKEDIDPNAKEEVVIIPDSREDDSEDEEEDEDNNRHSKTPKVGFADADLDSGLGLKMGDQAEDSDDDDDELMTSDL
ncbi:LOW QUALITY PROTEIN: cadherin-related family member 5 [Lates calcarifer]|uniref:LOW QUALITY PROTEIN: cadherin-related family member 5 n=1 Tax=Lates calcarifer TaxID=8187 RepID=A0AAJ8BA58_LATCA|nr:LOW QUALITY PROTEIN: cadherin-related family member 5 [Lates calcarifer]